MLQQRQAGGFQDKASQRSPNSRSIHWREIYKRAEGLYDIGEYEQALVWYHRGRRLKPKAREFIKGIAKCEQAIEYKCPAALNDLSKRSAKTSRTRSDRSYLPAKSASTRITYDDKPFDEELGDDIHHVTTLNKDKRYLQDFLRELGDSQSFAKSGKSGKDMRTILEKSLSYLDTRTTFWKQHMPGHALDGLETRPQTYMNPMELRINLEDDPFSSVFMTLLKEMMKANQEFIDRQYRLCIPRCESCIKMLKKLRSSEIDNKYEMLASLYSVMGNAQFELEMYEEALKWYTKDLELAREKDINEARSRALENMGRVYARVGEFDTAICVWKEKMGMCQSDRERAWLCHEIGYCYLNKKDYFSARQYAGMAGDSADLANDLRWQLNAGVLIAQVEAKMKEYQAALASFQAAAEIAKNIGDSSEKIAIQDAITSLETVLEKVNSTDTGRKSANSVKGSNVFLTSYFEDEADDNNKMAVNVPSNTLRHSDSENEDMKMNRTDTLTPLQFQSQGVNDSHYHKQPLTGGIERQVPLLGTRIKNVKNKKTTNTPFNQTSLDLNNTEYGTTTGTKMGLINEETTQTNNKTTKVSNYHNGDRKGQNFPKLKVHYNNHNIKSDVDVDDGSVYEDLLPVTASNVKKMEVVNRTAPNKRYTWKSKERLNSDNFPWKSKQHKPVSGTNRTRNIENGETRLQNGSLTDRSPGEVLLKPHPPRTPHSTQSDSTLTIMSKKQSGQYKKYGRSLTGRQPPLSTSISHPSLQGQVKRKGDSNTFQSPYGQTSSRYHGGIPDGNCQSLPNISVKKSHVTTSSTTNNDTFLPIINGDENQVISNSSQDELIFPELPTKHFSHKGKRRYMSPLIPETQQKPNVKQEGVMKSKPPVSGGKARGKNGEMSDMDLLKMLLDM